MQTDSQLISSAFPFPCKAYELMHDQSLMEVLRETIPLSQETSMQTDSLLADLAFPLPSQRLN